VLACRAISVPAHGSCLVPLGTFHIEEGLLLRQRGCLILQRDDGGRWRLDADRDPDQHLGGRVRIEGVRSGFDLLDVSRIVPC
jgi:hypothetical protein